MPFSATFKPRPFNTRKERRRSEKARRIDVRRAQNGDREIPLTQRKTITTVGKSYCRWPFGDPQRDDFYLCGAPVDGDNSYCPHHMEMAYTPPSKPKRIG